MDRPEFGQLRALIEESKALQDRHRPELSINRFQASLWDDLTDLAWPSTSRLAGNKPYAASSASPRSMMSSPPKPCRPSSGRTSLDGYRWLRFLWAHQLGGILADDMGLGKTLRARAHLPCPVGPS